MEREVITIVSGLPRSGTSMMMKMLEAGGMALLTDGIRTPDEDNPKGYYEFERVKQIERDKAWLEDARGKAVKMVAALLKHLPPGYDYEVIFMRRNITEVLASQRRMLDRRGEATDTVPDEQMAELFRKHVEKVEGWLSEQPNVAVIYVDHGDVLTDAVEQAERVSKFLSCALDAQAMAAVVDRSLYRQRQ
jgi:hypothetical protein